MVRRYPYIVLEGSDGVGKTTVRTEISRYLRQHHVPVLEVGQHSWLNIVAARTIIDAREKRFTVPAEAIIQAYSLDKGLHIAHNIRPNLLRSVVVADRSTISDAVYQEALYGLDAEATIEQHLNERDLVPELMIYVHVPLKVSLARIEQRSKQRRHYEREPDLRTINNTYNRILQRYSSRLANKTVWLNNKGPLADSFSNLRIELDGIVAQSLRAPKEV